MWTPRRVLLMLGGILLFGGMYGFYSRFLGWLDGLPPLPARMLNPHGSGLMPPRVRTISPTVERIREAFGPDCLEQQAAFYPTQLEFRNVDGTSTVLACGSPPFSKEGSKQIVLTPFSVAQFGAPKPEHSRQAGEAPEISTFHSDKAVLEFDRPVSGPNDMGKAKLIRMELICEPDPVKWKFDHRTGLIHITHNQRSTNPGDFVVMRTVGPMFYRDPKSVDAKSGAATGPDVWTDAAVEIVDRQNLPRRLKPETARERYRTFSLRTGLSSKGTVVDEAETAPVKGSDLQSAAAVGEVLLGQRLPPPTVTAIGLKIFLEPATSTPVKAPSKKGGAFSGLKRVELQEKVLVNLWIESQQELLDTDSPKPPAGPRFERPAAIAAVVGGLEVTGRLDRALLQVDTLGKLTYDVVKNTARFDVLPDGNPDLPNDVQVHRVMPLATGLQRLFCQFLELEFRGSPIGSEPSKASKAPEPPGSSFKQLRAWTEAPGRFVAIFSDPDRLEAYGQYLLHDIDSQTTTLRGLPLHAYQANEPRADGKPAGKNILAGGTSQAPATLIRRPAPRPEKPAGRFELPKTQPERAYDFAIEGPGRFELFDPAANANSVHATWQTRMTMTTKFVDRRELGLFTFVDGAMFEDQRSDFWLKAKSIQLWMVSQMEGGGPNPGSRRMAPHRLQAFDDSMEPPDQRGDTRQFVTSHSPDFDIEQAEKLTVSFRDGIPPLAARSEPPPPAPAPKPASAMTPAVAAVPPQEPQKAKPPLKIKSRFVDTWMVRYPLPGAPSPMAKSKEAADSPMKYELEKARCEGQVTVHQDPTEPGPDKQGLDILGQVLFVDNTPDGSVMTVTGADEAHPGQVHHDGTSIIGGKIVLDQLHSTADVEGRGSLKMPANSTLQGGNLKQASVIVIHWRDSMRFRGADKRAEFKGKITAQQNEAYVTCHEMHVNFDRVVDLSQRAKRTQKPGQEPSSAKIDKVNCYPAPDDLADEPLIARQVTFREVSRDETGRIVKTQLLESRELEMNARVLDATTREPFQRIHATGPGRLRVWQSGLKDESGPEPKKPTNAAPEAEMKLTIVNFAGNMIARDFGPRYQEATFNETVKLLHCPADREDANVDFLHPPSGAVTLSCAEKLIVSSQKQPNATVQALDAYGNAYIRSDEYDGWGEHVSSTGPTVTLEGGETTLARISGRFSPDSTNGKRIVYNRSNGEYTSDGSFGGRIKFSPKK